jgi:uncharacterized protein (DUF1684 family)
MKLGLVALAIAVSAACSNGPPDAKDYATKVAADRAAKDASFKTGNDSPIPADHRNDLLPLTYFPIDPDYDVPAVFKAAATPTATLVMPTSTGAQRDMRRIGTLEFSLKGQQLKLSAFVEAAAPNVDTLFVPFTDLTSGTETYPGGRYLDLVRTPTGIYEVDFNRAYFPYCYYNPTYECPYPPAENRLKVPVRAGERLKHPNT